MPDTLLSTLHDLLRPGAAPNPALVRLVDDYRQYHLILALQGSLFAIALLAVARTVWVGLSRGRLAALLLAALTSAFLILVVAANLSNVLDPMHGFRGALGLLEVHHGLEVARVHRDFASWLRSGDPALPAAIQQHIDARLAWQRPKAIASTAVLVASCIGMARFWRVLLDDVPRSTYATGRVAVSRLVGLGALVVAAMLSMLMTLGNTQASLAPLAITMFHG